MREWTGEVIDKVTGGRFGVVFTKYLEGDLANIVFVDLISYNSGSAGFAITLTCDEFFEKLDDGDLLVLYRKKIGNQTSFELVKWNK